MSTLELSHSGPGQLRMQARTAELPRLTAASSRTDAAIRASTAAVVLAVAGIAAYISYWHAYTVVRQYGERRPGLRVLDGHPARRAAPSAGPATGPLDARARHRRLARRQRGPGLVPRLGRRRSGGWPAVALVGSYEMLAWVIRTTPGGGPGHVPTPDHGVPQPGKPGSSRQPAAYPVRETVTAVEPDGASLEPGSAHELSCAAGQVHGPGRAGPDGTDQAGQVRGPVPESTGPRGPLCGLLVATRTHNPLIGVHHRAPERMF